MSDTYAGTFEETVGETENERRDREGEPLPYVDPALDLTPRAWLVAERIPMRNVTSLSGEGSIGKSLLLMQLSGAVVLGKDWIGTLPEQGPALYMSCEEDDDEVRRRMEAVAQHLGSTRQEMIARGLRFLSFAGRDAVLAQPDRSGIMRPTPLFERLRRDALQLRPKLIVFDTVADVYGGNEIVRGQTRQFITMLRGLAIDADAAVLMSAHPSLTGIANDSGLSGSTAWHNSVRARMYFKPAPGDDTSLRVLEVKKSNYSQIAEAILLRWRDGVYVVELGKGTLERLATEQTVNDLFLKLLRRHTDQGRNVTDKKGTSYAPAIFANEPEARESKTMSKMLAEAMTRLFAANKIKVVTEGPASKPRTKIVQVEAETATIIPFSASRSTNASTTFQQPSTNLPPLSPHTPHDGGSGKGLGGSPPLPPSNEGKRFRVLDRCPAETVCLQCQRADGEVVRIKDVSKPGAQSETLHEACAHLVRQARPCLSPRHLAARPPARAGPPGSELPPRGDSEDFRLP